MAPSIAARRVDGVQGARCPKGSAEMAALSVPRARPLDGTFAAHRGVRTAQEDSIQRYVPRSSPVLASTLAS